jgi:hypothetical protein
MPDSVCSTKAADACAEWDAVHGSLTTVTRSVVGLLFLQWKRNAQFATLVVIALWGAEINGILPEGCGSPQAGSIAAASNFER